MGWSAARDGTRELARAVVGVVETGVNGARGEWSPGCISRALFLSFSYNFIQSALPEIDPKVAHVHLTVEYHSVHWTTTNIPLLCNWSTN